MNSKQFFLYSLLFSFLLLPHVIWSKTLKDFVPPNALVFDVGANVGIKTEEYLAWGARSVVCVEPNAVPLEQLIHRFINNNKVIILPIGLSDIEGTIQFWPCQSHGLSTASSDWKEGRFKDITWDSPISIPVKTLDSLIEEYGIPDFCKIDTEGYEYNILKGLTTVIPLLSFEFANEFLDTKTRSCLERLSLIGYTRFNVAFGLDTDFAFREWLDWETLLMQLKSNSTPLLWGDIYAKP